MLNTPKLAKGYKLNFETLMRAARNGDLALVSCVDAKTGEPRGVLCALQRTGDEVEMIPLAKLFDGNPYEEVIPPMETH